MRVRIGIVGVLGVGGLLTVAIAQGAGQRGARLLAPRVADDDEVPVIARAAGEPLPQFPESTPVVSSPRNYGQNWLNGTDPNVRVVGATGMTSGMAGMGNEKPLPQPMAQPRPPGEPSMFSRGVDKFKSVFTSSGPTNPTAHAPSAAEQASANAPFRGTSPTGQPVYAGPPAYRWYGWGSVTPGANPYAPNGHFPKASANWYSIAGATPGAFPTQVVDPYKLGGGTEPPAYVAPPTPTPPASPYTPPVNTYMPPTMTMPRQQPFMPAPGMGTPRASGVPIGPETRPTQPLPIDTRSAPPPTISPLPTVGGGMPVIPAGPIVMPSVTSLPVVSNPATTPLPVMEAEPAGSKVVVPAPGPITLAPMTPVPTASLPPLPTMTLPPVSAPGALPTMPASEIVVGQPVIPEVKPVPAPGPLPVSVTEEPKWQPTNVAPARTEWNKQ